MSMSHLSPELVKLSRERSVDQKSTGKKSNRGGNISYYSNLEFITSLNKYIPSLVLQQLVHRYNQA